MRLATLLTAAALLCAPTLAEACGRPGDLSFPRGATGAELQGAAPRGQNACWSVRARAGQTMEVTVTSTEGNAVFQIYAPGWQVTREEIQGTALPGTEDGKDATRFSGTLPSAGRYLIVVGATRGGAEYRLRVTVK